MSKSLTLVFDRYNVQNRPLLAFERMRIDCQDRILLERLQSNSLIFEEGIDWYCDVGVEYTKEDVHGRQLTYVPASTLVKVLDLCILSRWDTAVLAMLKKLPSNSRIILWWN